MKREGITRLTALSRQEAPLERQQVRSCDRRSKRWSICALGEVTCHRSDEEGKQHVDVLVYELVWLLQRVNLPSCIFP